MSQNPSEAGQTERFDPSEATMYIAGVGLVQFADYSYEYTDDSDTVDGVDNVRVHNDAPVRGSGDFELLSTSPAAPRMTDAILNRTIGAAVFNLPSDAAKDRAKFSGVRLGSFGQDDSEGGYSGDWEADWAIA